MAKHRTKLLEASCARIDRRVSAQIVAHVASGLHAAHELRDECGIPLHIVHRDVSAAERVDLA